MAKSDTKSLGFAPPLLGSQPMRLPIIAEGQGWFALAKPAEIGVRPHPWDPTVPNLDSALNLQLSAQKRELTELGCELIASVYYLDPPISGVALFAKTREGMAIWRNAFGSNQMSFRFVFATRGDGGNREARQSICDVPLRAVEHKGIMAASARKGKKTKTLFRRLAVGRDGWSLWEGVSEYLRPHQVRAHAALVGLPVGGDKLYGGEDIPVFSRAARLGSVEDAPAQAAYSGPAIHLMNLQYGVADARQTVRAPLPTPLAGWMRRLGLKLPGVK